MTNERRNEILEVKMDTVLHGVQMYRVALDKIARMKCKAAVIAAAAILEVADYTQAMSEQHGITEEEMNSLGGD